MPLLYFDVIEGRNSSEIKALLDTAHAAMVDALGVPERDRYQVVNSHPGGEIVALDTGLGINRSEQMVIIHVVSTGAPARGRRNFTRCWPSGWSATAVSTRLIWSSRSPRTMTKIGPSDLAARNS
jgi:hypothetical protein